MKKYYLFVLVVGILSPWFWTILEKKLLIGFICLFLSVLIFDSLLQKKIFYVKKIVIFISFFIISTYLLITSFDNGLFKKTDVESAQIVKRQDYYALEFGKVYKNRLGIYYSNNFRPFIYKYISNIANTLDIETYFLPVSINDLSKSRFLIICFPLMLLGLYSLLKIINKWMVLLILFILLVQGFVNSENIIGPITFYPLMCSFISFGLMGLFQRKI